MRETQMQGFANTYLRDSGIQQWVDAQGGMTHVSQLEGGRERERILFLFLCLQASISHSPSGAQLVDISDID